MSDVDLRAGECVDVMAAMPAGSVDAIVTDPPYGLGFMGKEWDSAAALNSRPPSADETDARYRNVFPRTGKGPAAVVFDGFAFQQWCEQWARECLRVLKPGGYLLAFGGTRTWHRLVCAVEDAGFEIRDSIAWLYGSGFPKSLDVSKAIDKAAGAEREVVGAAPFADRGRTTTNNVYSAATPSAREVVTAPATDDARRWEGWGTALKPAHEPIVVARKPLVGTVASNVLAYGTGGLNVDACRIEHGSDVDLTAVQRQHAANDIYVGGAQPGDVLAKYKSGGRWPANVVLDESQAAALDAQGGTSTSRVGSPRASQQPGDGWGMTATGAEYDDSGGASRFFYVAKASAAERPQVDATGHPTVKPLTLMRWLVRLVCPPGGTVLDPFIGSGSTAEACVVEGFDCVGIERDETYLALARARLGKPIQPDIFGGHR